MIVLVLKMTARRAGRILRVEALTTKACFQNESSRILENQATFPCHRRHQQFCTNESESSRVTYLSIHSCRYMCIALHEQCAVPHQSRHFFVMPEHLEGKTDREMNRTTIDFGGGTLLVMEKALFPRLMRGRVDQCAPFAPSSASAKGSCRRSPVTQMRTRNASFPCDRELSFHWMRSRRRSSTLRFL